MRAGAQGPRMQGMGAGIKTERNTLRPHRAELQWLRAQLRRHLWSLDGMASLYLGAVLHLNALGQQEHTLCARCNSLNKSR